MTPDAFEPDMMPMIWMLLAALGIGAGAVLVYAATFARDRPLRTPDPFFPLVTMSSLALITALAILHGWWWLLLVWIAASWLGYWRGGRKRL